MIRVLRELKLNNAGKLTNGKCVDVVFAEHYVTAAERSKEELEKLYAIERVRESKGALEFDRRDFLLQEAPVPNGVGGGGGGGGDASMSASGDSGEKKKPRRRRKSRKSQKDGGASSGAASSGGSRKRGRGRRRRKRKKES